jgi:thiol:disulfide interchange protein
MVKAQRRRLRLATDCDHSEAAWGRRRLEGESKAGWFMGNAVDSMWALRGGFLAVAVLVIGLLVWVGKLHRSKWDMPPGRLWLRYAAGLLLGMVAWLGLGVYRASSADAELPCYPLAEAERLRAERGSPMLIDFTADWCTACHELREKTLNSEAVRALSGEFVCAVVDVTEETEQNKVLMAAYGVQSLPRLAMVGLDGAYAPGLSMTGFVDSETVLASIRGAQSGEKTASRMTDFERARARGGWALAFLVVFVAGIGASLTPCVYPLIPITIGVFGATEASSRAHAFGLSMVYVAGIAVTYSGLGVAAAKAGGLFGAALQSGWVLGFFAMMFVALALSSLGMFELNLPASLQARLAGTGKKGFAGALVMGLLAGVIAAPCVGPILSGVLLFITQTQDVWLGVALMTTFALGMGLLFLVLGTFSSLAHRLPSSGAWMDHVKTAFALVFVAMAARYLALAVPGLGRLPARIWEFGAGLLGA